MATQPSPATSLRTVLVCDDRPELRAAISLVLAEVPRFRIVGEASNGPSCLRRLGELRPDVLILDVSMPGGGPQIAHAARALFPRMGIVVFSGRQDPRLQREMLAAGADQYVVKTGRLRPLIAAIDRCDPERGAGPAGSENGETGSADQSLEASRRTS